MITVLSNFFILSCDKRGYIIFIITADISRDIGFIFIRRIYIAGKMK